MEPIRCSHFVVEKNTVAFALFAVLTVLSVSVNDIVVISGGYADATNVIVLITLGFLLWEGCVRIVSCPHSIAFEVFNVVSVVLGVFELPWIVDEVFGASDMYFSTTFCIVTATLRSARCGRIMNRILDLVYYLQRRKEDKSLSALTLQRTISHQTSLVVNIMVGLWPLFTVLMFLMPMPYDLPVLEYTALAELLRDVPLACRPDVSEWSVANIDMIVSAVVGDEVWINQSPRDSQILAMYPITGGSTTVGFEHPDLAGKNLLLNILIMCGVLFVTVLVQRSPRHTGGSMSIQVHRASARVEPEGPIEGDPHSSPRHSISNSVWTAVTPTSFTRSQTAGSKPVSAAASTVSDIELDVPMQKLIQRLNHLKEEVKNPEHNSQIQWVIHTLVVKHKKLLHPDFDQRRMSHSSHDSTAKWLHEQLNVGIEEEASTGSLTPEASPKLSTQKKSQNPCNLPVHVVDDILPGLNKWGTDMFKIAKTARGKPLLFISYETFRQHGMFEAFDIDMEVFKNAITAIEDAYIATNPYHNSTHAADVALSVHYFLIEGTVLKKMSQLHILATLVAAIVHDVGHPGNTNSFEVNTASDKAVLYNDKSVLENFHLATAFQIFKRKGCNIFANLNPEEWKEVRTLIIELVLATDLAAHFELVGRFKSLMAVDGAEDAWTEPRLVLKAIIKGADVAHAAKPWELHLKWTNAITEEFYLQGEKERARGLPISPFMDRQNPQMGKSQKGFIDFICQPLFSVLGNVLKPKCKDTVLDCLNYNYRQWDEQAKQEAKLDARARWRKLRDVVHNKSNLCKLVARMARDNGEMVPHAFQIPKRSRRGSALFGSSSSLSVG